MDIKKIIYQCNFKDLKSYYEDNQPSKQELSLAAVLFNCQKDQETFKILSFISEKFLEHYPKEDFAQIIWNYVGLDIPFLTYMLEHKGFEDFLGSYQEDLIKSLEELSKKEQNNYFCAAINDVKEKVKKYYSKSYEQQKLPSPNLLLNDTIRMAEISIPLPSDIEQCLDEHLLFSVYSHAKNQCYEIDVIDYLMNQTRSIREQWIQENANPTTLFSPFLYYVNSDILSIIGIEEDVSTQFNYSRLWSKCEFGSIDKIAQRDLDSISLPESLKRNFDNDNVRTAIWVLNSGNEFIISPQYNGSQEVHHTHLAKGKNIMAGGTILFSEDLKKIIAINNGTGHYKTTIESCLLVKEHVKKSVFDSSNTVICDSNWDIQFSLQDNQVLSKIKSLKKSWHNETSKEQNRPVL